MTISATTNRVQASGNGVTTAFAFAYPYRASSDLKVISRVTATGVETVKTEGVDYTVSGSANAGTGGYDSGTVTFGTAPASGTTITINREVPPTTAFDPTAGGGINDVNLEGSIDRAMLAIQSLQEQLNRALLLKKTSALANLELPEPSSAVGNQLLAVNAGGTGYELKAAADVDLTAVTSFVATMFDDANAGALMTTLGFGAFFQTLVAAGTVSAFLTALGCKFGSITVDFGSVGDNATIAAPGDTTVTGAVVGDWVLMSASGTLETTLGARVYGKIVSANTLRPYFQNDTSGTLDVASQTLYYLIIPKSLAGL